MSESEWVNGLLASCREWDGKAMNAIEGLSPEQLNWRPDKDTWSVLQQFHHLVLANGPYMGIIERLALEAPGHFKDYRPGLWGKSASPNVTGLTVGDITGIDKKGWEYLWVRYADAEDQKVLVKQPTAVYVEKVYESGNFAGLGIGV